MDTAFIEQHSAAVQREARSAESRWNKIITADDIEQEIWLFIMETRSTERFLQDAEPAQVAAALRTRADIICSKERLDLDHFTGNFHYTTTEVRDLLEKVYIEEPTITTADEHADITTALDDLEDEHPGHFIVLYKKYSFGIEPSDTKKTTRAVDALTTIMNRKRSQRDLDRTEGLGTKPKIPDTVDY